MNESNLNNLSKLTRVLGADRLLDQKDVEQIRDILVAVLANNKQELEDLTEDTKGAVEALLKKIVDEHDTYLEKTKQIAQEAKSETTEAINSTLKSLEEVKALCKEVMECKPENGEDADEEYVIQEVLAKIKLPEYKEVVLDDGTEIVAKINELPVNEDNQIDAKHIKNLPEFKNGRWSGITKGAVIKLIEESGAAGVTLKVGGTENIEQGTLDLIAGSGITITDNGDGTVTFTAAGGSGSPGGSTTQLQYNNAGAFGGIAGATTDGTATTFTTGNLKAADVKASGSGGLAVLSNAGTQTALFGAGGGANNTFYGSIKGDYLTASEIVISDGSKNIVSAPVATYPSLTELTYVKGVTSAIQTQLNAKQATGSYITALTGDVTASGPGSVASTIKNDVALGGSPTTTTQSAGDNTTKIATTAFVTTAVANGTIGLLDYRGSYDASTNLFPATGGSGIAGAILKGDFYICSVGGTLGGTVTTPGDLIIALVDTPGQTAGNWDIIAHNLGSYVTSITGTSNQVVASASTGAVTLSLPQDIATSSSPQFTGINVGHASDTTLSRSSAGVLAVEGVVIPSISSTNTLTNKTLTTPVINGATLNGDIQIDATPNTDDTWNGKSTNTFNAAGTIAQFDCVYLTSSSTWALTDADAIGTAGNVLVMMAGEAGTDTNPLRVIEPGSWVRNDAWNWTVGGVLYLDTSTAGGLTQTVPSGTDDVVKIVGHAVSADVIYFNPSVNWIIHT